MGIICPPWVEIGLTDLPKSGCAMAHPAHPGATGLYVCTGVTTTFFEKLDKFVLTKDYEELYNYTLRIIEFINCMTIFFQDS